MIMKWKQSFSLLLAVCLLISSSLPVTAVEATPVLTHEAVEYAQYGQDLTFTAAATDASSVTLYYRDSAEASWQSLPMTEVEAGRYCAVITGQQLLMDELVYYIEAANDTQVTSSGWLEEPHQVIVNRGIHISHVDPPEMDHLIYELIPITVYGENFTEDMTLTLGGHQQPYTLLDETSLQFQFPLDPRLPMGVHDLVITRGDDHATLFNAITFTDTLSSVRIGMTDPTVYVGQQISIPVRISSSGPITDVSLQFQVDEALFDDVDFVLCDAHTGAYSYSVTEGSTLSIQVRTDTPLVCSNPLGYLQASIRYTDTPVTTELSISGATCQGVDMFYLTGCKVHIRNDISMQLLTPDEIFVVEGMEADASAWQLKVQYAEESQIIPVTADMVNTAAGIVRYMGQEAPFAYTLLDKDKVSIGITKAPDKLTYAAGEPFDPTGMEVTLYYEGEAKCLVGLYMIDGFDSSVIGPQTLTVRYGHMTDTLDVTIVEAIPETITSEVYTIDAGFIQGIGVGTTVQELLNAIEPKNFVTITDAQGEPVADDAAVCTGMRLQLMDGQTVVQSLCVIVSGDVNGDGKISITDILAIRRHILEIKQLENSDALAADYNHDGKINITDYIRLKTIILGRDINA